MQADSLGTIKLKHLSCLRALEVETPHSYLLPEDVSFDNLTRYDISIGFKRDWLDDKINTSRRLKLKGVKGPHLVMYISKLLNKTEVLNLSGLDDIRHFVNELDSDGFLHLKHLSIKEGDKMQYIMNTMEMGRVDHPPPTAFPLLEGLNLSSLYHLEAVCHGPIPKGCFANLRILIITNCDNLKCISSSLPTAQRKDVITFYSTGTNGNQEQLIIPSFQSTGMFDDS